MCSSGNDNDDDDDDDNDDNDAAEIQFVSAYNRSGRQQQSIALKSPRSLRRRMPGSPSSSPRRSVQNDRGQ